VKHFKDGNTDITNQPRCGRPRTAATERNKQKVDKLIGQDRRITFREIAAQLGVEHHAVQEMMEILGFRVPRLLTEENNGWELPSHPLYSPDFAPSDYPMLGPRKPCKAGCEELERTSTAEAYLNSATPAEMHRSGWRYY
jgi:hypothetical protein